MSGMIRFPNAAPGKQISDACRTGSGQGMASKMLDNASMTIASRCHQNPVRHLPAIVEDRVPRERGHVTIRFLHDQIGRGKVPVAALATRKSCIETALRDPAQPERQRPDSGMKDNFACLPVELFDQELR